MDHEHHESHGNPPPQETGASCHAHPKKKFDYILWGSIVILIVAYIAHTMFPEVSATYTWTDSFSASVVELLNRMYWGIILGILFVGILSVVPQNLITSILGKGGTFSGILRATAGGVMLDLCSHGILMVGAKLYQRGASLGQVMAFLIASPWNSISLTLILWALVGFKWMIALLLLSMIIAVISGIIFDQLVKHNILPANPNHQELPENFSFWKTLGSSIKNIRPTPSSSAQIIKDGITGSKMVLRWIFFGVVLASLVRAFVSPEMFSTYFGPSLVGLGLTVLVATIMEVCSEGSLPIAADLLTRASAPGNAFAFLMTGVSTDYTEIMVLKDTTKSWKIAFFLPLVTVPQVLLIAWILNQVTLS